MFPFAASAGISLFRVGSETFVGDGCSPSRSLSRFTGSPLIPPYSFRHLMGWSALPPTIQAENLQQEGELQEHRGSRHRDRQKYNSTQRCEPRWRGVFKRRVMRDQLLKLGSSDARLLLWHVVNLRSSAGVSPRYVMPPHIPLVPKKSIEQQDIQRGSGRQRMVHHRTAVVAPSAMGRSSRMAVTLAPG